MKNKIIAFALILLLFACTKRERIGKHEYVNLSYEQTMCADPWPAASNDSLALINISTYLNASGLYVASLSIKQDGVPGVVCSACPCTTGKKVMVSTLNSENMKAKYAEIGFK